MRTRSTQVSQQSFVAAGLFQGVGEYGEAPDGEYDEREAGAVAVVYRVTAAGVEALADDPPPDM